MRTRVYIDDFNLYYGALKGSPHKWLNPFALASLLLPKNRIEAARYFTARVSARPKEPQQAVRQETYLRALRTVPQISTHFGHFLSHPVRMPEAAAWAEGRYKPVEVIKTEEKGSDVNLATHLLVDAFDDLFDVAVLVSNDSDLAEPLRVVRRKFNKTVILMCPHEKPSAQLRQLATMQKRISKWALEQAQFPGQLTDADGTFTKPRGW